MATITINDCRFRVEVTTPGKPGRTLLDATPGYVVENLADRGIVEDEVKALLTSAINGAGYFEKEFLNGTYVYAEVED